MKTSVCTKTGDRGTSSLFTGERRQKTDPIFEALGTVDELNSFIGLAASCISQNSAKHAAIAASLEQIQRHLLDAGSVIATPDKAMAQQLRFDPKVWTGSIEQELYRMEAELPPLDCFIVPGGDNGAAQLHVCRSVCRRAERAIVAVRESEEAANTKLFLDTQRFFNRLSDYFFVLARYVNSGPEKKRYQ